MHKFFWQSFYFQLLRHNEKWWSLEKKTSKQKYCYHSQLSYRMWKNKNILVKECKKLLSWIWNIFSSSSVFVSVLVRLDPKNGDKPKDDGPQEKRFLTSLTIEKNSEFLDFKLELWFFSQNSEFSDWSQNQDYLKKFWILRF